MADDKVKRKRGNPNLKKGVQPAHLQGKDFKARPENINKYGVPKDVATLRKMMLGMGNDEIEVTIGSGKSAKVYKMTRFERILYDWFASSSFDKQKAVMEYAIGKVPDELKLTGEVKHIRVSLKKKEEAPSVDPAEDPAKDNLDEVEQEKQ